MILPFSMELAHLHALSSQHCSLYVGLHQHQHLCFPVYLIKALPAMPAPLSYQQRADLWSKVGNKPPRWQTGAMEWPLPYLGKAAAAAL